MPVKKYTVTKTWDLATPSDVDELVINEQIDLAVLLSQRLQRNVRQGRSFRVHSAQVSISPQVGLTANHDLGVAFTGKLGWCPATKNSVQAWRHAFRTWRQQKQLRILATGSAVRYDDFEVAFGSDKIVPGRTSTLYANGLSDNVTESVTIYGGSQYDSILGTNFVSLENIMEMGQPKPASSTFPSVEQTVKTAKYTEEFPPVVEYPMVAHWSTVGDNLTTIDSAATVSAPKTYISDGATLCGILNLSGYMLPENTGTHIQDDMRISITLEVSMGYSLLPRPRRKKSKPKTRTYRKKKRYMKR